MRSGPAHPEKNRIKVTADRIKQYDDFIKELYHKGNQMKLTLIFLLLNKFIQRQILTSLNNFNAGIL